MDESEWVQVKIRIPKDVLEAVDRVVAEANGSRQQFILGSVENNLENFEFLRKFGLSPRRLKKLITVLDELGFSPEEGRNAGGAEPSAST